jgi:ADP-heptose:LPS heptosyltransferase
MLNRVRKIAVLRPNAVGDFVFALPALHALKHSYPDAEIVLLGKAWHAAFLQGGPGRWTGWP